MSSERVQRCQVKRGELDTSNRSRFDSRRRGLGSFWPAVGAAGIPLCFSNMADIVRTPTLPAALLPLFFLVLARPPFLLFSSFLLRRGTSNYTLGGSNVRNGRPRAETYPRVVLKFPITDNHAQRLMATNQLSPPSSVIVE